jgi:hypothetical protein
MESAAIESTNLVQYRIEMRASIIFDVIMRADATGQEITAQAVRDYQTVVDSKGGFDVHIGLPDCRLYIYTLDNWEPAEVGIVDEEDYIVHSDSER